MKTARVCEIRGCLKPYYGNGLCKSHASKKRATLFNTELTENEFMLLQDMRNNGFPLSEIPFELGLLARTVYIAYAFETYKAYKKDRENLAVLWNHHKFKPWVTGDEVWITKRAERSDRLLWRQDEDDIK